MGRSRRHPNRVSFEVCVAEQKHQKQAASGVSDGEQAASLGGSDGQAQEALFSGGEQAASSEPSDMAALFGGSDAEEVPNKRHHTELTEHLMAYNKLDRDPQSGTLP